MFAKVKVTDAGLSINGITLEAVVPNDRAWAYAVDVNTGWFLTASQFNIVEVIADEVKKEQKQLSGSLKDILGYDVKEINIRI